MVADGRRNEKQTIENRSARRTQYDFLTIVIKPLVVLSAFTVKRSTAISTGIITNVGTSVVDPTDHEDFPGVRKGRGDFVSAPNVPDPRHRKRSSEDPRKPTGAPERVLFKAARFGLKPGRPGKELCSRAGALNNTSARMHLYVRATPRSACVNPVRRARSYKELAFASDWRRRRRHT